MKIEKLKQHPDNIFIRNSVYGVDWDLYAISLIKFGVEITEKTVDEFYSHILTYVHEKCNDMHRNDWMFLRLDSDDEKLQYVRGACYAVKQIVKSYDRSLHHRIFTKDLRDKYCLMQGFVPGKKTVKFVNSLKLSLPRAKRAKKEEK